MIKTEFTATAKTQRLANKGRWIFIAGEINGYPFWYKAYNTWVQVFEVQLPDRAVREGGPMDCSVAQHNEFIKAMLDLIPDPATA